jgi:hypothetical protein
MLTFEVWVHPFLFGGIAVDQAKSGVLLATALACREDTQLQEPVANGIVMSNHRTISVDCQQYQTQALHLQRKMRLFLKVWETTSTATPESMPREGAGTGGRGHRAPDLCDNKEGERSSILEETELRLG